MRDKAASQLGDWAAQRATTDPVTASHGAPLDSITTSLTSGARGPILLQVRSREDGTAEERGRRLY
jgi:catalase